MPTKAMARREIQKKLRMLACVGSFLSLKVRERNKLQLELQAEEKNADLLRAVTP